MWDGSDGSDCSDLDAPTAQRESRILQHSSFFSFVSFSKQSLPTLFEEGDLHEMMQDEGLGGQGSLDDKLQRAL